MNAIIRPTVSQIPEETRVPNPGFISGTHHLTFCVGGAQEDYDFHVRTLGLKSVKKTVLFDGEIPIYHLYYANRVGDASTILTAFPYRQAGWMGKRGTNQAKSINLAVPAESLGYWADRLSRRRHRRPTRSSASAPSGSSSPTPAASRTSSSPSTREDTREPYTGSDVPGEHAIRGAFGTTTSRPRGGPDGRVPARGVQRQRRSPAKAPTTSTRSPATATAASSSSSRSPTSTQGTWRFGEGTIHHHAFDVGTPENQLAVKDYIVGLGYTDVSDVKDRGYFFSVYLRTPGGALFELAYSTEAGFTIDEPEDELGTHMCIPPHWEDRRAEISSLEPIDTIEDVKS